jgi:hypothetical protein
MVSSSRLNAAKITLDDETPMNHGRFNSDGCQLDRVTAGSLALLTRR